MMRLLRLRLDLLLLATAVACAGMASWTAKVHSVQIWERFNRLASAIGFPEIENLDQIEVARFKPIDSRQFFARGETGYLWQVWVPESQTVQLRAATNGLMEPVPRSFHEFRIAGGRHVLMLKVQDHDFATASLSVDGEHWMQFNDGHIWNFDESMYGIYAPGGPRDESRPVTGATIFFRLLRTVRLASDETYDPEKHAFGLTLWLAP